MWKYIAATQQISMTEGDYGVALPITISGVTVAKNDEFELRIKQVPNGPVIISKNFEAINDGFNLILTSNETDLLAPGKYAYYIDWKRSNDFCYNIIQNAQFIVGDKA